MSEYEDGVYDALYESHGNLYFCEKCNIRTYDEICPFCGQKLEASK